MKPSLLLRRKIYSTYKKKTMNSISSKKAVKMGKLKHRKDSKIRKTN